MSAFKENNNIKKLNLYVTRYDQYRFINNYRYYTRAPF